MTFCLYDFLQPQNPVPSYPKKMYFCRFFENHIYFGYDKHYIA